MISGHLHPLQDRITHYRKIPPTIVLMKTPMTDRFLKNRMGTIGRRAQNPSHTQKATKRNVDTTRVEITGADRQGFSIPPHERASSTQLDAATTRKAPSRSTINSCCFHEPAILFFGKRKKHKTSAKEPRGRLI